MEKFIDQNFAFGLVGQNCPFVKFTEIAERRNIGFRKAAVYNPNIKVFENSVICMDEITLSGEIGVDKCTLNKDSFIVIPSEYIKEQELRPQFKISETLLNNLGICSTGLVSKNNLNKVHIFKNDSSETNVIFQQEDFEEEISTTNDDAVKQLCIGFKENNDKEQQSGNMLSKADATLLSDFCLSESRGHMINLQCKIHSDISKRDSGKCLDCLVLTGNSQAILDKNIQSAINNNMKVEPHPLRPGKFRLRQTLTFTNKVEDIGSMAASNLELCVKRLDRLAKNAVKRGFWKTLNQQVVDRVKRQEFKPLTNKELKEILNGDRLAQWVCQNYVEAPGKTTKFRLITDSSMEIRGLGTSIAGTNRAPRVELQNFVGVTTSQRTQVSMIALDLQRAYYSVLLNNAQSYLFCTPWCVDPSESGVDPKKIFALRSTSLGFGMGSASSELNCGLVVHGRPRMKMEESRFLTLKKTFVDNLNSLDGDVGKAARICGDMVEALDQISLIVDKIQLPHWMTQIGDPDVKKLLEKYPFIQTQGKVVSMGYVWCLDDDVITPNLKINVHESRRGAPQGPGLETMDIRKLKFTRRLLSKLVPSLFDSLGAQLAIAICVAKILLSAVCRKIPLSKIDEEISAHDPELAEQVIQAWEEIQRFYTGFIPMRRCVTLHGYRPKYLICSHDGSISAFSSVIHTVSEHVVSKKLDSYILGAKSTCSVYSPYGNECRSYTSGLLHILGVLSADQHWINQEEPLEIILAGDNCASSHVWGGNDSREMQSRVLKYSVIRCLFEISDLIPGTRVRMCYVPGSQSTSDKNSKLIKNILETTNSSFWRHGPEQYLTPEILASFTFLDYKDEKWSYCPLPDFRGTKKKSFAELIEMKQKNELKVVGPSVVYQRGVGAVSSSDDQFLQRETEFSEIQGCRVQKTTAFLCNSVLNDLPAQDMTIDNILFNTISKPELQKWNQDTKNETEIEDYEECEDDIYEIQDKFRSASQFSITKQSEIRQFYKGEFKIVKLSDELKLKYAESRMTRNIFLSSGKNLSFVDTHVFEVNADWTEKIMATKEDFLFNFNVMKNVLSFVSKIKCRIAKRKKIELKSCSADTDVEMSVVTWRTLLKHEQSLTNMTRGDFFNVSGITSYKLRIEQMVKPILPADSRLLQRLIDYIHKVPTGYPLFPATHLHLKTVLGALMQSRFSVYCFSMKKVAGERIGKCTNCRRTDPKRYQFKLGPRYSLSGPNVALFGVISIDPTFKLKVKALTKSTKSSMDIYLLNVVCVNTGCCDHILLRSLTHKDIVLGIRTLEISHNTRVSIIFTDAGSGLKKSLLEEHGSWTVINHSSSAQLRNYSESRTRLARHIFRSIFRKCRDEEKNYSVKIDFMELLYLAKLITVSINVIPYTKLNENNQGMSPACLMYGAGLTQAILCESEHTNFSENPPLAKYKEYMEKILECRNEVLLTLAVSAAGRQKDYNLRNHMKMEVNVGDIVLWRHGGRKFNLARVMEKFPPPSNSVAISYGGKKPFSVMIESLRVIVPINSEEGRALGQRDIQSMPLEIQRVLENSRDRQSKGIDESDD